MKHILITIILALCGFAANAQTTYHICRCDDAAKQQSGCTAGNDSNNGLTPSTPKLTLPSVGTMNGYAGNSQVLFCKGGAFGINNHALQINNTTVTPTAPLIFDSYQPPWYAGNAKPWLWQTQTGGWNIFYFMSGGSSPGTPNGGYTVRNLKLQHATDGAWMIFCARNVRNLTVEGNEFIGNGSNANGIGVYMGDTECSDVNIVNNDFTDIGGQGILGGPIRANIENNRFVNVGFGSPIHNHPIYLGCNPEDYGYPLGTFCKGVSVVGNHITYPNNTDTTGGRAGVCNGAPITVHGVFKDLIIEGNTVDNASSGVGGGCFMLQVTSGAYGRYEGFFNVVIRNNTLINPGGVGIDLASVVNGLVENNMIVIEATGVDMICIAASREARNATYSNEVTRSITIRNNSCIFKNAAEYSYGIKAGREGSGYIVSSNLIIFDAASTGSKDHGCYDISNGTTPAAFTSFDYNLCYNAATSTPFAYGYPTYSTQAAFIAAGYGANNINLNPNVTNTPSRSDPIIKIGSGSAASGGDPARVSPWSYGGYTRAGGTSIGAYQVGRNPP